MQEASCRILPDTTAVKKTQRTDATNPRADMAHCTGPLISCQDNPPTGHNAHTHLLTVTLFAGRRDARTLGRTTTAASDALSQPPPVTEFVWTDRRTTFWRSVRLHLLRDYAPPHHVLTVPHIYRQNYCNIGRVGEKLSLVTFVITMLKVICGEP
jgi:hypothetical protein